MEAQENIYPFDVNELYQFIEKALTDKSFHGEFYYGALGNERTVYLQSTFSIPVKSKIDVFICADEVRHIFYRHGDAQLEAAQGQIGVTPQDFVFLWDALAAGILIDVRTRNGQSTTLKFGLFELPVYYYIVEIRRRGWRFNLLTIYKKI